MGGAVNEETTDINSRLELARHHRNSGVGEWAHTFDDQL